MGILKECKMCEGKFRAVKVLGKERIYCSHECYLRKKTVNTTVVSCGTCGGEVLFRPSMPAKFCSLKCYWARPVDREYATCRDCKQRKHRTAFYRVYREKRNGLSSHCRPCRAKRSKGQLSYSIAKLGVTREDYDALLAKQGQRCAICKRHRDATRLKRLVLDHDHETGKVRSLLCINCNLAIGLFLDNVGSIEAAGKYLRLHGRS